MKKYITLIIMVWTAAAIADNPDTTENNSLTKSLMQLLSQSTTLWRNSDDWKDNIKKHTAIHTCFNNQAGTKINFKVIPHNDNVEIITTIEEQLLPEITTQNDEEFQKIITQKRTYSSDYSSECTFKTDKRQFNRKNGTIKRSISGTCKTRIMYTAFLKEINS